MNRTEDTESATTEQVISGSGPRERWGVENALPGPAWIGGTPSLVPHRAPEAGIGMSDSPARLFVAAPGASVDLSQLTKTMDCGDSSCLFRDYSKPSGMRTNGGCQCFSGLPPKERRFVHWMFECLRQISGEGVPKVEENFNAPEAMGPTRYRVGFSWPVGNGQNESEETVVEVSPGGDPDKECEAQLWDMMNFAGLCTWWDEVEDDE